MAQAEPGDWELDIPRFDAITLAYATPSRRSAWERRSTARADFTGMSGDSGLYLADVFHAAFVHGDESGTVAAAATGSELSRHAAVFPIVADHPFVFVIRDKLTGAILFVGRVADPS